MNPVRPTSVCYFNNVTDISIIPLEMVDQSTHSEVILSIFKICLHHFNTYTIEKDQATQSMEGLLSEIDREQIKVKRMLYISG